MKEQDLAELAEHRAPEEKLQKETRFLRKAGGQPKLQPAEATLGKGPLANSGG